MDLSEILNKTKKRSEQIKIVRKPPSIASLDRPYSAADISEKNQKTNEINDTAHAETDNKLATNRQQTDNKTGNKPATNRQQTDNKKNHLKRNWQQTDNRFDNKLATNRQQTGNKLATKTSFSMLVGLQRTCLLFVYQSCKANRSKVTEPLSLEHVAQHLKRSSGAVKTTFQRLEEKRCLIRVSFKNGRGGWSIYELPENIFTEMLRQETDNKLATNRQQTDNKLASELATNLSSSSSYINTTTTEATQNLTEEWQAIDMESLKDVGFTAIHLAQIAQQGKLSAEMVQDSIHAFDFDLKNNKKGATLKGSPLNFFMGILRNGQPYAPPSNYESPQDRKMRIYLKRKREIENARAAREDELIKLAFAGWEREQSEDNKQALLPEDIRASRLLGAKQASLRAYFIREIWPQKRKELEKEIFSLGQVEGVQP
jgi:biotin operon repressor